MFRLRIILNCYRVTGLDNTVLELMVNIVYVFALKDVIFLMADYIMTPTIGEILWEEFMKPMDVSAYKLAQEIHVPVSRIQDILHDRRKITADTSLRLAQFFGVSDKYFLDMQNDIDIRNLKESLADDIDKIKSFQAV